MERRDVAAAQVQQLIDGYRKAALALDRESNRVEKEIGRAALRTNATQMLKYISTRSVGVGEATLQPLRQWVADYSGGDVAERAIAGFDNAATNVAKNALREVGQWALKGNSLLMVGGVFGTITGVVLGIVDFGRDAGASLITALAAGAIPGGLLLLVLRGTAQAGSEAVEFARTSWAAASALGVRAMNVLESNALVAEREIMQTLGTPHIGVPLVSQARSRAQTIVGLGIAAVLAGLIFLGVGLYLAVDEYSRAASGIG